MEFQKRYAGALTTLAGLAIAVSASGAEPLKPLHPNELSPSYGSIPGEFTSFDVVLEPEKDEAEWWAGAPSVIRDDDGTFWLACRMRTADAPRGLRGHQLRILKSNDGVNFEEVQRIHRTEIPIPGFERPSLLRDPDTGKYKLYACGPWQEGPWSIIKFDDAERPDQFDPTTARPVIQARDMAYERDIRPHGYKDPVVIHAEGAYHCYVIGQIRRTERIYHFTSEDGEDWEPVGNHYQSLLDLEGWHDFYVRPASVVPIGVGYFFFYEGSNVEWYDPVYNMGTGIAFTFDLHNLVDITREGPLAVSSTPSDEFHVFRYSSWLRVDDEWFVYAEVSRPNNSHEIRVFRIPIK